MSNSKSFLELKARWKDDHMFEIKANASNGCFSGATAVYNSSDITSLLLFAEGLIKFPLSRKTLFYELGKKDGYAYLSIEFYVIDQAIHTGVKITMEKNSSSKRANEKDKVELELLVEPSSIDQFQKELIHLAKSQEGTATLYGL